MKKGILSFVSAAAIAGALGFAGSASADEVTVKKGDTLWDIAKEHNVTVQELKDWNNLSSNLIRPEDQLKVALTEIYHIQKGDTLSEIAENYDGVTWSNLQHWNAIKNADLIFAGDSLKIYVKGGQVVSTPQTDAKVEQKSEEKTVQQEKAETTVTKPTDKKQPEPKTEEAKVEKQETVQKEVTNEETTTEQADKEVVKELTMVATAYTATCEGCSGTTSTGINLLENPHLKVISVDPSVIPLGSKVYVEGYGEAIAGDTGGAIVGNKIDIFIPNKQDAINWGVREVQVKVYK